MSARAFIGIAGWSLWISVAAAEPKRIVTLSPALAEMVWEIDGTLDRLVGVSEHTDFPAGARALPTVGPFHQTSVEAVAKLKPDLVLATRDGNPEAGVKRIQALGIPVSVVDTHSIEQWLGAYAQVGTSIGRSKEAAEVAASVRRELEKIPKWGVERAPAVIFFVLQESPLMTAGNGTFLSEALNRLGGQNLGDEAGQGYPRVAREWIVRKSATRAIHFVSLVPKAGSKPPFWSKLPNARTVDVPHDLLSRPSARLIEGLRILRRAIP